MNSLTQRGRCIMAEAPGPMARCTRIFIAIAVSRSSTSFVRSQVPRVEGGGIIATDLPEDGSATFWLLDLLGFR